MQARDIYINTRSNGAEIDLTGAKAGVFPKPGADLWVSQSNLSTRAGSLQQLWNTKSCVIQTVFFLPSSGHTHFNPHIKRRILSKFGYKQSIFKGGAKLD